MRVQRSDGDGGSSVLDVTAEAKQAIVSPLREFVTDFFGIAINDLDKASRIEVACHELLENAIKGATAGTFTFRAQITPGPEPVIELRTSNRASGWDIAMLQRVVRELRSAANPLQHYLQMMALTAGQTEGSGLGLGRIRAEANMEIGCEAQGDIVSVFARMTLQH
jgi:hypothetical protein